MTYGLLLLAVLVGVHFFNKELSEVERLFCGLAGLGLGVVWFLLIYTTP
jgi:hypothetical protein